MAEGLASRVRRIIIGGAADLVDAVETAQGASVMREALREIEGAMDDVRAELARSTTRRLQTRRHIEMTRGKLAELSNKARAALGQGRDDLAEAAVARQIDLEAQIPVLETAMREAEEEQGEFERSLAALAGRKHEMEADLAAFASARRCAECDAASVDQTRLGAAENRAERASEAFGRAMKGAGGLPGPAASDADTRAKLSELDAVLRRTKIADRLALLRSDG